MVREHRASAKCTSSLRVTEDQLSRRPTINLLFSVLQEINLLLDAVLITLDRKRAPELAPGEKIMLEGVEECRS
jgi:hypothetical protein